MTRGWRTRPYTLIEAMFVCAIATVILTGAMRIFYEAFLTNRQFTANAWANQQLDLIHRDWQQLVHACSPETWGVDDAGFFYSANRQAELVDGKLRFTFDGRQVARLLPKGAEATFEIVTPDSPEGPAPYAVLDLRWTARLGHRDTPQHARLVAAAPVLPVKAEASP